MLTFKQYITEVEDDALLTRFARRKGVKLDINTTDSKRWGLVYIERKGGPKGAGSSVVRAINKQADKKGAKVRLFAPVPKLQKYYSKHGYGFEGDSNHVMYRKPRKE